MRRVLAGVLAIAMATACGPSPAASSPSAAATSAAAKTSAPAATTAAAATAAPATSAPVIAFEDASFAGTWTNQTFGSTGAAKFDVKVDRSALTLGITITLGGNVFGAPAPAPETFTLPLGTGGASFSGRSKTFGDVTASLKDGKLTFKGENVPGGRVKSIDGSGTYTSSAIDMTYSVVLADGSTAKGVVSLKKA